MPDLFAGSQVVVFGRYREGGPRTVTLRGHFGGKVAYPQADISAVLIVQAGWEATGYVGSSVKLAGVVGVEKAGRPGDRRAHG